MIFYATFLVVGFKTTTDLSDWSYKNSQRLQIEHDTNISLYTVFVGDNVNFYDSTVCEVGAWQILRRVK